MISQELYAAGLSPAAASGTPARRVARGQDRMGLPGQNQRVSSVEEKSHCKWCLEKEIQLAWDLQGPSEMEPVQINNRFYKRLASKSSHLPSFVVRPSALQF